MKFKFVFFSSVWCIQSDHRRPTSKKKYRFCVLDLCLVSRTLNLISLTLNDDFTFSCKSIDLFKSLFAVDVRCQDSWNSVYVFVWVCLCTRLSHYKFKNLEQTSVEQCDTQYREQTIEFVKKKLNKQRNMIGVQNCAKSLTCDVWLLFYIFSIDVNHLFKFGHAAKIFYYLGINLGGYFNEPKRKTNFWNEINFIRYLCYCCCHFV